MLLIGQKVALTIDNQEVEGIVAEMYLGMGVYGVEIGEYFVYKFENELIKLT